MNNPADQGPAAGPTSDTGAVDPAEAYRRDWEQAMADAVTALTRAARLRRPVYQADTHLDTREVTWGSDPSGRSEPADFAEFAAHALAATAANLGGIETLLAGRPGSWEADHLRNLLTSTVGTDEEHLWAHRTEPLTIHIPVDKILTDLGAWDAYDDAHRDLDHAEHALNLPPPPTELTTAQETALDQVCDARDRLDQHRERAWAKYGEAYKQAVLTELKREPIPGLTVRVQVHVTTDPDPAGAASLADAALQPQLARLLDAGQRNTPLPIVAAATPTKSSRPEACEPLARRPPTLIPARHRRI